MKSDKNEVGLESQNKVIVYINPDLTIDTKKTSIEALESYNSARGSLDPLVNKSYDYVESFMRSWNRAKQDILNVNSDKPPEDIRELKALFPDIDKWIIKLLAQNKQNNGTGAILFWMDNILPILDNMEYFESYLNAINFTGTFERFTETRLNLETNEPIPSFLEQWGDIFSRWAKITLQVENYSKVKLDKIIYPVDVVNYYIWDLEADMEGRNVAINVKRKKGKKDSSEEVYILYSIDFDKTEDTIEKRLTQFDKRAYIAIGDLYHAGNKTMTLTQILCYMGYTETSQALRGILKRTLSKLRAHITLSNAEEIEAGYAYPECDYDGVLLKFVEGEIINSKNGKFIEAVIHVWEEPPLFAFARGRKNITTIPLKVFQSSIRKDEASYVIEDYLLYNIARSKGGKLTLLFDPIFHKVNATTNKQMGRCKDKVERFLNHYQICGYIKDYSVNKTRLTISLK